MPEIIIIILIGLVAGILSGMFGIGGGAIIVPALILFLGFTQTMGNGTSLAALLLPVGIFACIEYYRSGKLKIAPALSVALGLGAGSWFGAVLALGLPAQQLKVGYGIFLILISWRYLEPMTWFQKSKDNVKVEETAVTEFTTRILAVCFGIGVVAGVASGMFGIGGGVVIVPALTLLLKFDQKLATGTSLGALLLPVALPGAFAYWQAGDVNFGIAFTLAIMLLIFAFVGARITLGLPTKQVRLLYGIFLVVMGLRFLFG